jgi:hypothetical protein
MESNNVDMEEKESAYLKRMGQHYEREIGQLETKLHWQARALALVEGIIGISQAGQTQGQVWNAPSLGGSVRSHMERLAAMVEYREREHVAKAPPPESP